MAANPLLELQKYGQSIWYNHIRRALITSGELAGMIERDGLAGATSNLAILEKAITASTDYDQTLKGLITQGVDQTQDLLQRITIQDYQLAADILFPVFIRTRGTDGYLSVDISPYLANDSRAALEEARRLHADIRRDNVMIKIPATTSGISVVQQLLGEGISVCVTHLFDVDIYEQVVDAHMAGVEAYHAKGGDIGQLMSVASFPISLIDTYVDSRLERMLDETTDPDRRRKLKSPVGKVAVANARLVYARYRTMYASERWQQLRKSGAKPQRLLWSSTGTRNPRYLRTLYIEELVGEDTIVTFPSETYIAFRESGRVRPSLTENWAENLDAAREIMNTLAEIGISMKELSKTLLDNSIKKLCVPYDRLIAGIEAKRQTQLSNTLDSQSFALGDSEKEFQQLLGDWRIGGKVRRLWAGDATLWTGTNESDSLSWLHIPEMQAEHTAHFARLAEDVRGAGFEQVVVLGMGGSALCPDVLARAFDSAVGYPQLLILDSIVPGQVRTFADSLNLKKTLFVVSSKSGGTIETNALLAYFLDRVKSTLGPKNAGKQFIAITDPRTRLHARAKAERFRHIYFTPQYTPGRFASLSNLGMIPAALLGLNIDRMLTNAAIMVHSCASCVPPELNPGVCLGLALGSQVLQGRNKLTVILSPALSFFAGWLEQLLSESTGKDGKGIVVITDEPLSHPAVYGPDRLFVHFRLTSVPVAEQDAGIRALEESGRPVIRINLRDPLDLGQEFFRWQMATAVAGSVLGVNPFNMPDVEAAKVATRARMDRYVSSGKLDEGPPLAGDQDLQLFADARNADALLSASGGITKVEALLSSHLRRIKAGDYFAINAHLENNESTRIILQSIRFAISSTYKVATTLGFSPRLLHSTGQLHKGGADNGIFLQITAEDDADVSIPGQPYTFGVLNRAQALGDFEVLNQKGRRLLRVHLKNQTGGLERLKGLLLQLR